MEDNFELSSSPPAQTFTNHLRERRLDYISIEKDAHITSYYTMFKVLGKGSYGVVYAARECRNNSSWAIKILAKKEGRILKIFEREIEILKFVNHPNIIKLNCIVESPTSLYLIVDLCDGVLSELFKTKKIFSECEAMRIIKELVNAVSYLHNNFIAHRDIKMENILLIKDDSVINELKFTTKLTDFGLSTVKTGVSFQDMIHDRCGTLAYMAPEILIKRSYSQQCDVWAIGVLLFALISGEFPFARPTIHGIELAIISENPNLDAIRLKSPNKECFVHLIQRLLHKDPAHRSTAIEILDHPWILERPLHDLKSCNVLDMMAQWRDELSIKSGLENDLLPSESDKSSMPKSRRSSSKNYVLPKTSQKPKGGDNQKGSSKVETSASTKIKVGKRTGRQSLSRSPVASSGIKGMFQREQRDIKVPNNAVQNGTVIKQEKKRFIGTYH